MTNELLDQLLYSEEGGSLDFKRDQYLFDGETNETKSKLLKDILAFANSWDRSDAYILIGVDDVQGGKGGVVGITSHLADANLQQFVNEKLNRPLTFSYSAFTTSEGKQIGIIHIPYPDRTRPYFLKSGFGSLKASEVYVRRGSSNATANPDEIAKMGIIFQGAIEPTLDFRLIDNETNEPCGSEFSIDVVNLQFDIETIPIYGNVNSHPLSYLYANSSDNGEYYVELAKYLKIIKKVKGFKFEVENTGTTLLSNVRVKIHIKAKSFLLVSDDRVIPSIPEKERRFLTRFPDFNRFVGRHSRTIQLTENDANCDVLGRMLDIQPRDSVRSEELMYIGGDKRGNIDLEVTVFADNLPSPKKFPISIRVNVTAEELDVDNLRQENL